MLKERNKRIAELYRRSLFSGPPLTIKFLGGFGLELDDERKGLLDLASTFIDAESEHIVFDLTDCTRLWPSGITLLCSLVRWIELTSLVPRPQIASIVPNDSKVHSYLGHCGFYEYVSARDRADGFTDYDTDEVVRIRREPNRTGSDESEDQIADLVRKHGIFDQDQVELFVNYVLLEVFANVTEHGVGGSERGWWILAQLHKRHKLISVCVADNGIGIRNSLMSGPERSTIGIPDVPASDGDFIRLALESQVTGAVSAPFQSGRRRKAKAPGAGRGNGLKRISNACERLGVRFTILSHHGYAVLEGGSKVSECGSRTQRVFAGTLYHFSVPARG